MGIFKARLIERIKRTETVESFRFAPKRKIEFLPGQFLKLIFLEHDIDNEEFNKYLSFSSSPTKEYIEVTKRLSDSKFSRRLKNLEIGDELLFKAPLGNCVFKDSYRKIAFLIGGIGITPVISIIEYIVNESLNTDVLLFYSNRTEDDIAFKRELDFWRFANKNIKVFYTVTACEPKDTACIIGQINKDLIMKVIKDLGERVFFIFGPPVMVDAMKNLCTELDCKRENIKIESFIGY